MPIWLFQMSECCGLRLFGLRDEGMGIEIFIKHVPEGVFNRRLIIDDLARIILVHQMRMRDRRHRC
ncbi:hypothetical protein D3C81_2144200 [compost metagenome]